ncbi:hypothetical protein LTR16_012359, partial [Cryomyces antarcticus]
MSEGMMVSNGAMQRPSVPHPGFNQPFNQQQIEMLARQQANGRMPNGAWQQGPPQMMMQQPGQQAPNMTPQQRNAAMPPPPAPPVGADAQRTQPSSPQQLPAPPTPSQSNKTNPKGKKDAKNNK